MRYRELSILSSGGDGSGSKSQLTMDNICSWSCVASKTVKHVFCTNISFLQFLFIVNQWLHDFHTNTLILKTGKATLPFEKYGKGCLLGAGTLIPLNNVPFCYDMVVKT